MAEEASFKALQSFAYVLWTQVAHLVSEKMALREQVERQQEQIELLEDQLRDMGPLPWP